MGGKLLIVDDEPDAVSEMVWFFEKKGINVVGVTDAGSALNIISLDDDLQAVISDLKMPIIDGFGVLEAARRRMQEGRLSVTIAVTGHATPEHERRAATSGATYFFQKPLNLLEILRVVECGTNK